ncbi:DUF6807 domain-containing protein [Plantactinospora soyae]|uniref:Oxidoreductase n=1 Tax=Plantactinospora soyae TaxID=1544732 RepID=A0A927RBI0_9ACTN|nr:PmoA family protein [Plantactinospora soyae]MBE1491716.1 hypothetical protein [Plantactinospora soyae]
MSQEQTRPVGAVGLRHVDLDVAEYVWQPVDLPRHVSPRPFLHPVRTLDGVAVTDLMPGDHPHHLGVSIAVPDLAGHNFWGGRTFVRAHGPTRLDNHGTQRHEGWVSRTPESIVAALAWAAPDGTVLLRERRGMAAVPLDPECWALDLSFELTNVTAEPLSFASPATNGRPDAGYGGFFWRAPLGTATTAAFGPRRRGVRHLHGRRGDWLALTGASSPAARWTLVFVPVDEQARADPWFVRTGDYPGVGSCLAWERPLVVQTGDTLRRRIITIVADGTLTAGRAARLAAAATAHATDR